MMNRSARLMYVFAFLSFYSAHAQQSDFISANASASPSAAALVMDGNKQTAWTLTAAGDLSQDQSLTLALQVPGNVQQLTLDATGLSAQLLKKMLGIYITYDPMNPGNPIDFTIAGNGPFTLTFPARYGAHIKLLFKGGLTRRPIAIREVLIAYATSNGEATASRDVAGKPWMDPKMLLDQRVETLLSVMTPAQKMELLREGWGIPGIPSLGIPAMKKVEAIHGFSYGCGATIFPQSIALGATWDKTLVEKVADAIGDETVSAGAVQAWSPVRYTSFSYSNLTALQNTDGTVAVSATVANTGRLKGDEVAQLYVTDLYASVKTRVMELKDFQRVTLAPGESQKISFTLSPYQLSLLNDNMDRVVEAGEFKIMVGGKSPSYIASDKVKNSVGFKTPAEGVNATLDYTASCKGDFSLSPGDASDDPILHKKRIPVTVTNNGNLTDIGKLTMYLNGQQAGDVHHFELGPASRRPSGLCPTERETWTSLSPPSTNWPPGTTP